MKEEIIKYLIDEYNPDAIITYGSYADGSANANSDFDALIIAESSKTHDESVQCGVILDVFIYSAKTFTNEYALKDFIQIYDGKIVLDKFGTAKKLKEEVMEYITNLPMKSSDEIIQEIEWCKKMVMRTYREDAEGYYRWHWLLMDSLEIYFDVIKKKYWGPKKALRQMKESDLEAYKIYEAALKEFSQETLSSWIDYISKSFCK